MNFDVTAEESLLENGRPAIGLKFLSQIAEVNVLLSVEEFAALRNVLSLAPDASLTLGVSAESRVHWSRDNEGRFYLSIGHDDETWDIGITLSRLEFENALGEGDAVASSLGSSRAP